MNVSDGSATGYISYTQNILTATNETEQVIGYTELKGGTRGYLQEGDKVRLLSPGSPLQSLIVTPVPTSVGEVGHEALFLFIARAHRRISALDIGSENDELELDIEFESALLERLTYYMRRDELGARDDETQAQLVLAESAFREALPDVLKRIRAWKVAWYQRQGLRYRQKSTVARASQYAVGARGEEVA